jgi:SAM-dependent methyltransferase
MGTAGHWDSVYGSKGDAEVSWTEAEPARSLALIAEACPSRPRGAGSDAVRRARVIDVGGGTSRLAERLLDVGYAVTVLDVSAAALARAREYLGAREDDVQWVVADVTCNPHLDGTFDVWHDRAVFHFLTDPADRAAYAALLARSLAPGGHAIIATFAPEGPERCSGLPVRRYDGPALAAEFAGVGFMLVKTVPHVHVTPWGKPQAFQYSVLRRG